MLMSSFCLSLMANESDVCASFHVFEATKALENTNNNTHGHNRALGSFSAQALYWHLAVRCTGIQRPSQPKVKIQ